MSGVPSRSEGPWATIDEATRAAEGLNACALANGIRPLTWFVYQRRRGVFDITPVPFRSYKTVAIVEEVLSGERA